MRAPFVLLGGVLFVGAGTVLMASDVPGRWVLGPVLVLVGLALKAVGLLVPDEPAGATRRGGLREPITLGGAAVVERPRAGAGTGRLRARAQTGQTSSRYAASQNIHS